MAFDVGTIEGRVKLNYDSKGLTSLDKDMRKADKGMDRLGRSSTGLGSKLRTGLAAGAIAGGAALAGGLAVGLKTSISAASDLDESLNKNKATFESSATAVEKWSRKSATALGLSQQAALDGAASIGAMLKPMGISADGASKMSMAMTQLAADMASFNNEDPTEMLDRIRAGLSGESEPLKRFGTVLSETRVEAFAWANGIAKSGEKLTEQQKIMGRYQLLLSDTKDQQGDFGRTSKGLANQQRILKAQFENLAASVGRVFLPIMTKAMTWLNGTAVAALRSFFAQMKDGTGAGGKFRVFLEGLWKTISGAAKDVWPSIRQAAEELWPKFKKAVQDLLPVLKEAAQDIGNGLKTAAEIAWPVIKVIASVVGTLIKAFTKLPRPVRSSMVALVGLVALGVKIGTLVAIFGRLFMAAKTLFMFLRMAPMMMGPVGIALAVLVTAAVLIIKHWGWVKNALKNTWDWIKNAFSTLVRFVVKAAKMGFLGPIPLIISRWKDIVEFFKSVPGRIVSALKGIGSFILRPFKWAYEKIKGVIDGIVGTFEDAINKVKGIAGGVSGAVGSVGSIVGLSEGGKVGPSAGGARLFVAGEGGKDEWVISQEGNRKRNQSLLMEAAGALGVPMFKEGGKVKSRIKGLNRKITNAREAMELKRRGYELSGGEISGSEYRSLIRMNRKIEAYLTALVKMSKGQQKVEARRALRSAQLDRWEMERSRIGDARERRKDRKDKKAERAEAIGNTPNLDFELTSLETQLALADGGYGGNAEEIRAKMKAKLEKKLKILRGRLKGAKGRTQVTALNEAIQNTISELSGFSTSSGTSIVEQLGQASELRYSALSSFGSNAMQMGLGSGGRSLAKGPGGTTVVLNGEFKLDANDPHASVRSLGYQLANNLA